MEVRKGYKQTDVGVIPEDWEVKFVEEIAEVKSGKRLPLGDYLTNNETPHPYIRVLDMFQGGVSLKDIKYVPDDVYPAIMNYRIFKDDIFISVAGTLGIAGKIPAELDGANLTENADRLTNIQCNRDYLLYVFMSSLIQNTIDSERTLGAQPKLALTRIRKFQIPLPPTKAEQTAIATALSDVDALISSLEKLITKKRHIKQGAMQLLLTGKRRLPGFSEEWEVKKLGEILTYEQPTNYLVNSAEYNDNNDIAVLTANKSFVLGYTDEIDGIYNDVPVIIFDDFTTASKLVDFPFKVKSSALKILKLRDKNCELRFVFGKMQLIRFSLGDHKRYWISEYQNLEMETPSFEEQTAIANGLSEMDAEIEALEQKLIKYELIKQGMMQELLTGKKRLI